MGWDGVGKIPTLSLATLHDLGSMLNLLRYLTFTFTWCYVTGWGRVGIIPTLSLGTVRYMIFGVCWTCYAAWPSLAHDATLLVGSGGDNTNPVFCYATWSLEYVELATLLDLHLHMMLRYWVGWGGDNTNPVSCYAGSGSWWQSLDRFIPSGLNNKDWSNGGLNQNLIRYMHAFVWRYHLPVNVDLKDQLAASLRWKRNCARPQKKVWKHKMLQFADKNSIFGKMTAG